MWDVRKTNIMWSEMRKSSTTWRLAVCRASFFPLAVLGRIQQNNLNVICSIFIALSIGRSQDNLYSAYFQAVCFVHFMAHDITNMAKIAKRCTLREKEVFNISLNLHGWRLSFRTEESEVPKQKLCATSKRLVNVENGLIRVSREQNVASPTLRA